MIYSVSNSTDPKEVGHYMQCKGLSDKLTSDSNFFKRDNSMTNLNNKEFPKIKPNLIFELEDNAILTDVISTSNISAKGLLVNNKFKEILSQLNIAIHRFYEAIVISKEVEYQYYWLHFVKDDWEGVDLKKSSLYRCKSGLFKLKNIVPISYKTAISNLPKSQQIFFESIILLSPFKEKQGDLFFLPMPYQIFASKNLLKVCEQQGITGIDFNENLNKWLLN